MNRVSASADLPRPVAYAHDMLTPRRPYALGPSCALAGIALAAWAASAARPLAAAPSTQPSSSVAARLPVAPVGSVFHIEKSENKNQVHYAVQVDAACRPQTTSPIYGYWRDLEHGPGAVSELLDHEQPAYGLRAPRLVQRNDSGGVIRVSLRAFPDRPLSIELFRTTTGCGARTLVTIRGQPAILSAIYVDIGFLFSVNYALLRGIRVSDGQPVQEKIHD